MARPGPGGRDRLGRGRVLALAGWRTNTQRPQSVRHLDRRQVLDRQASHPAGGYDGLVATLLEATAFLDQWAPQSSEAPLLLLGGGARGRAWQETVRRLSGRPVLVVELSELVAYGAAIQAAALLTGRRWPA